ncbi:MAG: (Fe-S)-binding protein [Candidatus Jordarchaeum sp.]|uniref:(Fe-S)-binding protein n=1 Tax=Candidatus Jordarchaeum sp. TaxID=2823881 RepID=UPI00404961A4
MALEKYKDILHRCYKCQYCRTTGISLFYPNCPSYVKYRFETFTGGGRVWTAKGLAEEEFGLDDDIVDILFACQTCGNCSTQCIYPIKDSILRIIEATRAEAVNAGLNLPGRQKDFGVHLGKEHNPYLEPHSKRWDWLPKGIILPEKSEMVYFVGCTSAYRQKVLAQDTVAVFDNLNLDFTIMKDEWCCTSPLLRTGQWETDYVSAPQIAQHNIEEAKKVGACKIVTTCAGCFRVWKKDYLEEYDWLLNSKHDFEVLHTTQLLENMVKNGEIELKNEINMRVTYHDPCHLGRHMGVYDAPRNILKAIPGIEIVEMPRTRENAWCCGSGGGVKSGYGEWSVETAYERVKEAEKLGVEAIVSACPFCWRNLEDAIKQYNSKLQMLDVIQLVRKSMGI